ncbi:MAG: Clp protease N-terminal domain-containing protein [Actinomycetota bacterium]|nr:Clp protease N-terminal domain-containing protein [Actinomycetota bacterium]
MHPPDPFDRSLSPSHVLAGLASGEDSLAARILCDHELTLAALRAELADALR